jgi:Domain of unknown function (DUF3536)
MGNHNVSGGVRKFSNEDDYRAFAEEAVTAFRRADFGDVTRAVERRFGESNYSLRSLFRDELRRALDIILVSSLGEAESLYRQIYEHRAPLMRFLTGLNIPLPRAFQSAAEVVLNRYIVDGLEQENIAADRVLSLLEAAKLDGVGLDLDTLEFGYRKNLERMTARFVADPSLPAVERLGQAVSLLDHLPFTPDLWTVQNGVYRIVETVYPAMRERANGQDETARAWLTECKEIARRLAIKVPEP